jgi:TM2 domain-containing membrane protein YozV
VTPQTVDEPVTAQPSLPAPQRLQRNPVLAASLSIVPGLGQVYNRQWRRAVFFLLSTLLTIGPAVLLIMAGERLGSTLLNNKQFTAFLLLAFGSIIVFLALFLLGLAFWASAIIDARRSAIDVSSDRASAGRWWFMNL